MYIEYLSQCFIILKVLISETKLEANYKEIVMADKIKSNHTVEEYSKKYRNRKHRLIKYTKKEVEDFDKKYSTDIKDYLLKDRKWWLIGDTYYEIPKAPRLTWFRNLNAGVQASCCLLAAGVVATAVTVPTVMLLNHKTVVEEHKAVIDVEIKDVTCTQKTLDNGALEITLKYDTVNKEIKSLSVTMGDQILKLNSDYTFSDDKIVINKDVLDNNKTVEITIKPVLENKIGAKSIIINKTSVEIEEGKITEVTASLSDKASKTITAKSSDESVATVVGEENEFGITGKKAGNATITFTCEGYKSATCAVTVNPKTEIITKEQWLAQNTILVNKFLKATSVYDKEDLTVTYDDTPMVVTSVGYEDDPGFGGRGFYYTTKESSARTFIAGNTLISETMMNYVLDEKNGGQFKINEDGSTEYYCSIVPEGKEMWAKSLKINKFGYATEQNYCYIFESEPVENKSVFTYAKEPHEPQPETLTKDDFLKLSQGLFDKFNQADSVYSLEQIDSFTVDGLEKKVDKIAYSVDGNGKRICAVTYDTTSEEHFSLQVMAYPQYYGNSISEVIADDGHFTLYPNGDLEYYTDETPTGSTVFIKKIRYNKYGYITDLDVLASGTTISHSISFNSAPQSIVAPVTNTISVDSTDLIKIAKNSNVDISSVTKSVTKTDTKITIAYNNESEKNTNIIVNISSKNQSKVLMEKTQLTFAPGESELVLDLKDAVSKVELGDTLQFSLPPVTPDPDPEKIINIDSDSVAECISALGLEATSVSEQVSDKNKIMNIKHSTISEDFEQSLNVITFDENGNQFLLGTTIVSFKAGTTETNVNLEEFIKMLASEATLSFTITPVTPEDEKTAGVNYESLIAKFESRGSDIEIKASSSTKSISRSEPAITIAYANGNEELTVGLGIYNKDGELLETAGTVKFLANTESTLDIAFNNWEKIDSGETIYIDILKTVTLKEEIDERFIFGGETELTEGDDYYLCQITNTDSQNDLECTVSIINANGDVMGSTTKTITKDYTEDFLIRDIDWTGVNDFEECTLKVSGPKEPSFEPDCDNPLKLQAEKKYDIKFFNQDGEDVTFSTTQTDKELPTGVSLTESGNAFTINVSTEVSKGDTGFIRFTYSGLEYVLNLVID